MFVGEIKFYLCYPQYSHNIMAREGGENNDHYISDGIDDNYYPKEE